MAHPVVDADLVELPFGSAKADANFPGEPRLWRTRLHAARKRRKLTLKAASLHLGIHLSHLTRVEHGVRDVPLRLARLIADLYGYPVEYLWVLPGV